jgi:hypothetical protein
MRIVVEAEDRKIPHTSVQPPVSGADNIDANSVQSETATPAYQTSVGAPFDPDTYHTVTCLDDITKIYGGARVGDWRLVHSIDGGYIAPPSKHFDGTVQGRSLKIHK